MLCQVAGRETSLTIAVLSETAGKAGSFCRGTAEGLGQKASCCCFSGIARFGVCVCHVEAEELSLWHGESLMTSLSTGLCLICPCEFEAAQWALDIRTILKILAH